MTLLDQLLFWGLVLPCSCLKLLIHRGFSPAKVKQSPPKLHRVKGISRGTVGVQKMN
ncbi:hypothetical protein M595_5116 [Lyngbya aestuarii BL J]|uniref:Uncharacterized protein n=1 Tax=Lyngbya aestuarii BL J TaxID=1348334 RepID=U7QCM7_9CYAN|nr:hypothetical protein M595_5116 [Lyngbya aestuarii BL J]